MAPQVWTTNTDDAAGYQVDDLIIDLGPRRVRRAGTVIRLQALSFDLLVALVRAAPNLVSFDELCERVWPGLVITPETVVQRVKLLRRALGDDPRAPHYIEGVRGRGYRLVADVRPLTERQGIPELSGPPALKESKEEETGTAHPGSAATGAAAVSPPTVASPAAPRGALSVALGWIGGTLTIVMVLAVSWAIVHFQGESKSAEEMSSGTAPATIHSLVVLPLENLSGDKEQEYFADGMTDALTTDLAQISSLRVISRTSAMHFKASKETLPQIGHDLHVDAVVEGTVARGKNRVRVTAQLVEASTDRHLWARTYERDLKDVLELQDEIARDITEKIRAKLTPKERRLRMQVHVVDPDAYDANLRGWYWYETGWLWNKKDVKSLQEALGDFRKAIARDPRYAPPYAGLADSLYLLGTGGALPRKEAVSKAREAAAKAITLDPSLAAAHTALGIIKFGIDFDLSGAEAENKQAIALNPNDAFAHLLYSIDLVAMDRLQDARTEIERAQDLDPYSLAITKWHGQVLYHARRYDDALRLIRRGLKLYPDATVFYNDMADVYEQQHLLAEAFAARQKSLQGRGLGAPVIAAIGEAYRHSGYRGYLLKLAQSIKGKGPGAYAGLAHIYALLNDEPRALAALETAYKERDSSILTMRTAPEFDSIRSSPRFRDLVRRIGFPSSLSHPD